MGRFSMIFLAVLMLGGAAVLAITAIVAYTDKNRGIGFLCAVNAVVLVVLWGTAGYRKRENR